PELVARLRALLRRARVRRAVQLGELEVDEDAGEARLAGVRLELTPREFELLAFLVANAGRVFARGELLDRVWGADFVGTERTVDQHGSQLRAQLGQERIETARGRGYRAARPGGAASAGEARAAGSTRWPRASCCTTAAWSRASTGARLSCSTSRRSAPSAGPSSACCATTGWRP